MTQESYDRTKRHKTRYRGVSYREAADGSRAYSVYFKGSYVSQDAAGNRLTTEKLALERQSELRGAKLRGEQPVVASRMLFSELAETWLAGKARHLRPNTVAGYQNALERALLPRFGARRVSSITADDIAALIRDLEQEGLHSIDPSRPVRPLGRSSVENLLKPAQGIMGLAVRRRLVSTNPFHLLTSDDRPKKEEHERPYEWTDEDVGALLAASRKLAAKKEARQDYTLLLQVGAFLGLRIGEALGLQWQDFDSSKDVLHVRRQWLQSRQYGPTKTPAAARELLVPNGSTGVRQALLEHKLASRFTKDTDPIFASTSGKPLGHRNATRRGFEAARDEAGLDPSLTYHDLRHAAASRLIDAGLPVTEVAAFLGHGDANVTLRVYAHRFNRKRSDAALRAALEGSS